MSRVVVTGAGGLLGRELVAAFAAAGDEVVGLTHDEMDLERPDTIARLTGIRAVLVVNAAAWTDVDGCARDPERAMRINGTGAGLVAEAAVSGGAMVVQISTNEVFDGTAEHPYSEDDPPNPINPYGASKLAGERAVAAATDRHLVVRTAWLFSATRGFPERIRAAAARAIAADEPLRVVDDEWGNPTPVGPLTAAIVAAARITGTPDAQPILHLAGEPAISRLGWARSVLAGAPVRLQPIGQADYSRPSRVPSRAVLATDRARALGLPVITWQGTVAEVGP